MASFTIHEWRSLLAPELGGIFFSETEAKDLPHLLNKKRIEFVTRAHFYTAWKITHAK